jgi:hypothetical protein
MIWSFIFCLGGVFLIVEGFNTFNDPLCASARISLQGRGTEVICYENGSLLQGPIPGNLLAVGLMAGGLLLLALGISEISDSRKLKIEKVKSYAVALEILGTIKGQSPAVHTSSGAAGNLFWSTEKFVFLRDDPSAEGFSRLGPIPFFEVERPNFRMPILSSQGFLLEFVPSADQEFSSEHWSRGTPMSFTSESGKIKNLKKEIDRFKNVNPA